MAGSRVADVVNAAVDALKVDATLLGQLTTAKVYTHVPQKTPPPYVIVMGWDEVPWAQDFGVDNGGRQAEVLVHCVTQTRGTAQVDAVASSVLDVLTDEATWSGVTGYQAVDFVRNQAQPPADLFGDGNLWFLRLVLVRVTMV